MKKLSVVTTFVIFERGVDFENKNSRFLARIRLKPD
jgi:hypothetical protein